MNASTSFLCLALLPCWGCIGWIPDSGQYDIDRGTIDPAVRATFAPGVTTRADVLCQLGEPDWISSDEARIAYQIRMIDSYFFFYLVAGIAVNVWGEVVSELFEFDARGLLVRHRTMHQPYSGAGDGGPDRPRTPSTEEMQTLFDAPGTDG